MTPSAKIRFCQMMRRTRRLSVTAWLSLARSLLMSTTSAVSRATSVPAAPMATPTVARARAGASLTPSPTMATGPRACLRRPTLPAFSPGRSPACLPADGLAHPPVVSREQHHFLDTLVFEPGDHVGRAGPQAVHYGDEADDGVRHAHKHHRFALLFQLVDPGQMLLDGVFRLFPG